MSGLTGILLFEIIILAAVGVPLLRRSGSPAGSCSGNGQGIGKSLLLAGVLALLTVFLAVCTSPIPDANDDAAHNWMLSTLPDGSRGPYIYPLYARLLTRIYHWMPGFNWFIILQYVGMFLALWAAAYAVLRLWQPDRALPLLALLAAGSWCGALHAVTYTRSAALLAACGGVLVLFGSRSCKAERWLCIASGGALYLWGWMLRKESAQLMIPFLLMATIWNTVVSARRDKQKRAAAGVAFAVLLVAAAMLMETAGQMYLQRIQGWPDFLQFGEARTKIQDYSTFPNWETEAQRYTDAGFQWVDADMVYNWYTEDTENFTTERMQQMAQLAHSQSESGNWAEQIRTQLAASRLSWCMGLAALLVLLYRRRAAILPVLGCTGGMAAGTLFLLMQGRINERAFDALVFCALLTLLIMVAPQGEEPSAAGKNRVCPLCLAAAFALLIWGKAGPLRIPDRTYLQQEEMLQIAQEIQQDAEHVYVLPMLHAFSPADACGFWASFPQNSCPNLCFLGGWEVRVPEMQQVRQAQGIENPMRALMEDPRVRTSFDVKVLNYLQNRYHWFITGSRTPWTGTLDYGWYTLPQQPTQATEGWTVHLDAVQPDAEPEPADGTKGLHLAGRVRCPEQNVPEGMEYYLNVAYPEDDAFSSIALKAGPDGSFDVLAYNAYGFEEALQAGCVSLAGRTADGTVLDLGPVAGGAAE